MKQRIGEAIAVLAQQKISGQLDTVKQGSLVIAFCASIVTIYIDSLTDPEASYEYSSIQFT